MTTTKVSRPDRAAIIASLFLLDPAAHTKFVKGEAKRIGSGAIMLLLAVLLMLVAGGAGVFVIIYELDMQTLAREGVTANAVIVDGYSSTGRRGGTGYQITYDLTINGQLYRREVAIGEELFNRLQIGAPVTVRYLPRNPNLSTLWDRDRDMTEQDGRRGIGAIVGGSALVLAIVCVWLDERNSRISKGKLLRGRVDNARLESTHRGTYIVEVEYTFKTPDGRLLTRKARNNRPDLRKQGFPPPGTPVAVLYVDDRTHRLM